MTETHGNSSTQQAWIRGGLVVNGVSLSMQIYEKLRESIVSGRITPSAALNESLIAKHFGVSRTPVREASLRLREDGLIEVRRQSGTFVAPVDSTRVEEGMIVRDALEPRAAEIAAGKMNERILTELASETDSMEQAAADSDNAAFIQADDRFHYMLVEAGGLPHVAESIQRVNAQLDRLRYLSVSNSIRNQTSIKEHRSLIQCLRRGDKTGSAEILQQHLRGSWVLIRRYLQDVSVRDLNDWC